ncbi:hypothetical protein HNR46_000463 [Haloferula luteola]|uniref:Uncharacterized protein n=1 Tax=Haloferula luteola TaxID=595692 RepID=A0A840V8X9_9BACT|nr:hypothetical protein [Haloferula luteola]MBB5350239.1 hypothetical protein [Haloferula luteola]
MTLSLPLLGLLAGLSLAADTVSINFVGTAGDRGTLAPAESAGIIPATHWNNVTASGTALIDNLGNTSAITVTYATGSWLNELNPGTTPDEKMMRGYLDIGGTAVTSILLDHLDPQATYQLYLYSDGENTAVGEPVSRTGAFEVAGTSTGITDTAGEQFEGNFITVYPGTTGEGNATCVEIHGAARYTLSIRGFAADGIDQVYRAPLNGLQIVRIGDG